MSRAVLLIVVAGYNIDGANRWIPISWRLDDTPFALTAPPPPHGSPIPGG